MKAKLLTIIALAAFALSSCNDVLERDSLTSANDDTYWTSEAKVRMYTSEFYGRFFAGYGYKYSSSYAALKGYELNDDFVTFGNQTEFERSVPNSRTSTSVDDADPVWLSQYTGPTWNFAWVRKSNIMIDRISTRMGDILNKEATAHWTGVGRFFRGMEYAGLVTVFGDVPYYDKELKQSDISELYKPRTPRNEVMDKVYDDFKYALENVRYADGDQYVNRYIVAGFVNRLALVEGTWQKYHSNDNERAKKFLELSVEAGDIIKLSGKFDVATDFRTLFGSETLAGNKDCIMYRHYDKANLIAHSVASACNMNESRNLGPNLELIKAFICVDGKDWKSSTTANAGKFDLDEMIKTRDSRFEASFWDKPFARAKGSLLYITKFIPRKGLDYVAVDGKPETDYTGINNVTDYPVMRYAEVLVNWIEAKAELASMGGNAVTQGDIDASINVIRNRPIAPEAQAKGVVKTAPLSLTALPNDVSRDSDVPALLWEIRRERRMELAFEHSRILDLRRWKKLEYMDTNEYPDLLKGTWVNMERDLPLELSKSNIGIIAVVNADDDLVVYDGTNAAAMVGFYTTTQTKGRRPFMGVASINPYLAPVGVNQRVQYHNMGFELAQTQGWPSALPQ